MESISKQLESRFSPTKIEDIIAKRLKGFNPTATASQKFGGVQGCGCVVFQHHIVCLDTATTAEAMPLWTISVKDQSETYQYESIPLRR
jgi:hypothetical protein